MKIVRVGKAFLHAGNDSDGSLSELVGMEGEVVGRWDNYIMVKLPTGVFPFENYEIKEVKR